MGLDLILYKHTKDDMTWEEEKAAELAYGRKTWAIAEFFQNRCESIAGDFYYKVKESDWDDFINSLNKLNDPAFRKRVEDFLESYESMDEEEWIEKMGDTYDELEAWCDKAMDNDVGYTLGLDWELDTILRWFDADKEVRQAFKDGEDIRLNVSY